MAARHPGDAQARLPHPAIRWDLAVRRELLSLHCLSNEWRVEDLIGRSDRVGLDLRFPPQPVLHVEIGRGLPTVLREYRGLLLGNALRARLLDGESVCTGLLQVEQNRPGDVRSSRAGAGPRCRSVRALNIIRIAQVIEEPV